MIFDSLVRLGLKPQRSSFLLNELVLDNARGTEQSGLLVGIAELVTKDIP